MNRVGLSRVDRTSFAECHRAPTGRLSACASGGCGVKDGKVQSGDRRGGLNILPARAGPDRTRRIAVQAQPHPFEHSLEWPLGVVHDGARHLAGNPLEQAGEHLARTDLVELVDPRRQHGAD